MTPRWRRPHREFRLRWLLDSPLLLVFWALLLLAVGTAARIAAVVRSAAQTGAAAHATWAALVAEEAALQLASGPFPAPGAHVVTTPSATVHVEVEDDRWRLTVPMANGRTERFSCTLLPGAAHPAFAQPWTSGGADSAVTRTGAAPVRGPMPPVGPLAMASPPGEFVRDAGIALRYLTAGTDRADFRLDIDAPVAPLSAAGVVAVPGNLWIDAGPEPLHVELERDLTIVAYGNIYVGRSVAVTGPGRLMLAAVTPPGERTFVDRDGNGRWSAGDEAMGAAGTGPIEGGGAIWLGLPGEASASLALSVGLFATGPVHLLVDRTSVMGCLLAGAGVHGLGGVRGLAARASRWIDVEREGVPGFLPVGCPRPGRLCRDDEPHGLPLPPAVSDEREEGLYAAWSGR